MKTKSKGNGKKRGKVNQQSEDSFPASDPPSFTLVTGSGDPNVANKVVEVGDKKVIHVENGRAFELRHHLASHGISANILPGGKCFERLEVDNDVSVEDIQTILDQWER